MSELGVAMKGSCLCGEVEFELTGELPNIYQCHCSLCRKVSGSASNSAMLISSMNFKWIKGISRISSNIRDSGFRSDFCSQCGSPLPNLLKNGNGYWTPAGLPEKSEKLSVAAHVFVESKAHWDSIGATGELFAEMPDDEIFAHLLQSTIQVPAD